MKHRHDITELIKESIRKCRHKIIRIIWKINGHSAHLKTARSGKINRMPINEIWTNLRTFGNKGCQKFPLVKTRKNEVHALHIRRLIFASPLDNWNIVESDIKHHQTNKQLNKTSVIELCQIVCYFAISRLYMHMYRRWSCDKNWD